MGPVTRSGVQEPRTLPISSPGTEGLNDCDYAARLGSVFLEGEVRARAVAVAEIAAETPKEISLVQDDHVVEELAADRADHALGERVLRANAVR